MYVAVLSAFDAALWDICGKALGVPVYQLLAENSATRCGSIVITSPYSVRNPKPEEYAKVAREAADRGYTAIKFDVMK